MFDTDKVRWSELTSSWLRLLEKRLAQLSAEQQVTDLEGLIYQKDRGETPHAEGLSGRDDPLICPPQLLKLVHTIQESSYQAPLRTPLPNSS